MRHSCHVIGTNEDKDLSSFPFGRGLSNDNFQRKDMKGKGLRSLNCPVIFYIFIIPALLLLYACVPVNLPTKLDQHPSKLQYIPINFTPPKPERVVLPNGIVLYMMEDHEIPLINVKAIIRTGAVYEPEDKVGLALITGEVMRTGGTKSWNAEELNKKLEYMAAVVETDIRSESGSAFMSVLKKDFDEALSIFAEVLRYPVFEVEKVELAKMRVIESIRRQNDEPMKIAFREFKRRIYRDDPRGRIPTIKDTERITRDDLIKFHSRFFFPDNIIMGISGDFDGNELIEAILKHFGDWEKRKQTIPHAPGPTLYFERSVVYAPKLLPQSTILLGHLSCPKNHPDYYAMKVLNYILGEGSFNSRLVKEIRSNRGLAYSVGSFYRGDIDYGVFGAYAMTKLNTTSMVIDLILKEINHMITDGCTEEELTWAKESIINQYIFSFASTSGLVSSYINLEYDGLPRDYLETYPKRISEVTINDIKRVGATYLKPAQSSIVAVGDSGGFDRPLETFGSVDEADLSIY